MIRRTDFKMERVEARFTLTHHARPIDVRRNRTRIWNSLSSSRNNNCSEGTVHRTNIAL